MLIGKNKYITFLEKVKANCLREPESHMKTSINVLLYNTVFNCYSMYEIIFYWNKAVSLNVLFYY